MAKYGMSFCVLGMSEEFKEDGIAVNALWPRTGKRFEPKLIPCLYKNPHWKNTIKLFQPMPSIW